MVNYPASITKIMTALVTLENCSLDEIVTYSYYATSFHRGKTAALSVRQKEKS